MDTKIYDFTFGAKGTACSLSLDSSMLEAKCFLKKLAYLYICTFASGWQINNVSRHQGWHIRNFHTFCWPGGTINEGQIENVQQNSSS